MYRLFFSIFIVITFHFTKAQDTVYARTILNKLSSPEMYGRGYVKNGDGKAANFIQKEFKDLKLKPFEKSFYQTFSFPMNTFPGKMEVKLDGNTIKPSKDYVVSPDCKTINKTFTLHYLPEAGDTSDVIFDRTVKINYGDKYVVAPYKTRKITQLNPFKAAGVVIPSKSIYWWASTGHQVADNPLLLINDSLLAAKPRQISLNIKNKFIQTYNTQNVVGYIPGSEKPDSFIVFTAHYDHLGMMGKGNIFCGANDNASGTAFVMSLAKYFSKNKPKYSIAFILFAAEESGLIGSGYYTKHPLFPLSKIKTLINLDMVGSGSTGFAIVNGKSNENITNKLKAINESNNYFPKVKVRGEACNSDHCFFHKKGVPAIFIYTEGPECPHYHNLDDIPENVPMTKFYELQKLLIEFTEN